MNDPFDETLCDRSLVTPPGDEPRPPERSILLVIIAGSETDFGRHFVLEREEATIGRDEGNDIVIHDGKISKLHCAISVVRGGRGVESIDLRDLGTTNGTFVNGEPVARTTLTAGDKIQVGDTILQLSYGDEIDREYHARLFQLAARDALTGLYNKRHVLSEVEGQIRISRRSGRPFSVILLDIDDFKQVNDRFGHLAGDEYLGEFAGLLTRSLREQDIAGRIGGEEFLVILPETALDGAFQLAGRVRGQVEAFVLCRRDQEIRTTISAGVCQYEPGMRDASELLELADQAMYEAKKAEKNKVMRAALSGDANP
ncbi:MAG: GGDEF domain-containing protein [Acidobacteria bacterium]|jgi:diguanylate cyclase (GGDEF)-like protein|nr:GGDEF domain-containing protein [Acidobacteriota bacterium]